MFFDPFVLLLAPLTPKWHAPARQSPQKSQKPFLGLEGCIVNLCAPQPLPLDPQVQCETVKLWEAKNRNEGPGICVERLFAFRAFRVLSRRP